MTFAAFILGTAGTTPRGCGREGARGGGGEIPIIHCVRGGDHMFICETSRVSCGTEVEGKLSKQPDETQRQQNHWRERPSEAFRWAEQRNYKNKSPGLESACGGRFTLC